MNANKSLSICSLKSTNLLSCSASKREPLLQYNGLLSLRFSHFYGHFRGAHIIVSDFFSKNTTRRREIFSPLNFCLCERRGATSNGFMSNPSFNLHSIPKSINPLSSFKEKASALKNFPISNFISN